MAAYVLYLVTRQSKIKLPQQRISVRMVTLAVTPQTLHPTVMHFTWPLILFSDKHINNINLLYRKEVKPGQERILSVSVLQN